MTHINYCVSHSWIFIFIIFFICIPLVRSELHTLITTYTGVNGQTVAETPEVSSVTKLDGQEIDYYDSVIKKLIPKQDWMKEFAATEKWKEYTEIRERVQQTNKLNIPDLMQRFSQTGGVHTYQRVYGCVWDDLTLTGDSSEFDEYSYDGQDFISLDLKEIRYTASSSQAGATVMKWNEDRERLDFLKQYYRYECVYWLKELLHFPKASLKKTGTVPESTEPSLREPAVIDNKRDGSTYITTTVVVIIILVISIFSVVYELWDVWNQTINYDKKLRYYKAINSTPQNTFRTEDCSQSD